MLRIILFLLLIGLLNAKAQRVYDGSVMIGWVGVIGTFHENDSTSFRTVNNRDALFNDGFSSIADSTGKLIISCSVHKIYDGDGNIMEGGRNITPPKIANEDYDPK